MDALKPKGKWVKRFVSGVLCAETNSDFLPFRFAKKNHTEVLKVINIVSPLKTMHFNLGIY